MAEASGRIAGKTAFVTGGASGLGLDIVRRFVAEGADVVIADIDAGAGEALAAELGQRFVKLNVSKEEEWLAALDTCERIDILAATHRQLRRYLGELDRAQYSRSYKWISFRMGTAISKSDCTN